MKGYFTFPAPDSPAPGMGPTIHPDSLASGINTKAIMGHENIFFQANKPLPYSGAEQGPSLSPSNSPLDSNLVVSTVSGGAELPWPFDWSAFRRLHSLHREPYPVPFDQTHHYCNGDHNHSYTFSTANVDAASLEAMPSGSSLHHPASVSRTRTPVQSFGYLFPYGLVPTEETVVASNQMLVQSTSQSENRTLATSNELRSQTLSRRLLSRERTHTTSPTYFFRIPPLDGTDIGLTKCGYPECDAMLSTTDFASRKQIQNHFTHVHQVHWTGTRDGPPEPCRWVGCGTPVAPANKIMTLKPFSGSQHGLRSHLLSHFLFWCKKCGAGCRKEQTLKNHVNSSDCCKWQAGLRSLYPVGSV